jgi:hypothetical protein
VIEFGPKIALVRFTSQYAPEVDEPLNALFVANGGLLHNSVAGLTSWTGSYALWPLMPPTWPAGAGVAAFTQRPDQLSVLSVGRDGQLHVRWRARDATDWGGPTHIVPAHSPAPPGASVAVVYEPPETWFALFADNQGQIHSAQVVGGAPWQSPEALTGVGATAPGGGIVGIQQAPGVTSVLFSAAQTEFVHVCWRVAGQTGWRGPAPIHAMQSRTPAGAGMAATQFSGDDWFVVFVGTDGRLRSARVHGAGEPWHSPEDVSAAGIAPPGAPVAAIDQADWLINAFVVDWNGVLRLYWRGRDDRTWSGPIGLTPAGFARPGASVSAAKQADDVTVVAVSAIDGRPHICWVVGTGKWQGPARISWSRVTTPYVVDAPVGDTSKTVFARPPTPVRGSYVPGTAARIAQLTGDGTRNPLHRWGALGVDLGANTEHSAGPHDPGRLFIFSGDVTLYPFVADPDISPPWDADLVAYTDATTIDPDGFSLEVVSDVGRGPAGGALGRIYHPFAVDRLGVLGTNETPTGAFSYDGRAYVFIVAGGVGPVSYLASSDRPDQIATFRLEFKFSASKFWQVAPWVVRNADHPGLPTTVGDGVVMIGQGAGDPPPIEGMHLAWMPLQPGRPPNRADMLFYAGGSPARGIDWSPREQDAVKLFQPPPPGYTAVSLAWLQEPQRWILLYSLAAPPDAPPSRRNSHGSIVARVADSLVAWSDEIVVFSPNRDLANSSFPWNDQKSWAYGAFLLPRFVVWIPTTQRVKIRYLLSVFEPYQIQLMEAQITLD